GLYGIGIGVSVLMGLVVRFLVPSDRRGAGLAVFYVLALGGTTYMFSAVMLLWDKSQNTLAALRVSMMNARIYVASKALTLTAFALVEAAIVYLVGGGWPASPGLLAAGAVSLGLLYTLCGLAQVAPHASVTRFLMPDAAVVSMLLQLSVLYVFGIGPTAAWFMIPSMPALLIMRSAEVEHSFEVMIYAGVGAPLAILAAGWLCLRRIRRHTGLS
ncbi:MAG: hypothetical protein AAF449_24100, partial [Myxococcota bacterium]